MPLLFCARIRRAKIKCFKYQVREQNFENKFEWNEMKNEWISKKKKSPIWTWRNFRHTPSLLTTLCLGISPVSFVHSLGPSVQNMMWRRERGGHTFLYLHFLFHYYSYSLFYISYLPHLWSFQPVFMSLCFLNIVINVCFDSGTFWPWC